MFLPEGIIIPVITPVDAQGKFNEPVYRQLIDFWADRGIDGVFPFGTTGEFYAFDNEVYRHVLEVTKDAVRGRMAVYAGANHITTAGAVELAKIAEEVGVDALSVLTPMFVSQTQDELLAYYTTIANATSLPIIIYNNKPKTNVTVAPATVRKLAQIKNIVGVKDSTGDMTNTEEYIRLTRDLPDFRVLVGRDTLIYAGLCYGARAQSPPARTLRRIWRWRFTTAIRQATKRERWTRSSSSQSCVFPRTWVRSRWSLRKVFA